MSGVVVVNQLSTDIVNSDGYSAVVRDGYNLPVPAASVLISGVEGTIARNIRVSADGTVRVDPTGTTTQPVSGTVFTNQSGTWTVRIQDSLGASLLSSTTTPGVNDPGLVVRLAGSLADGYLDSIYQNMIPATTTVRSVVASSATAVTLLASNVLRKGATIFNASSKTLYIALGATSASLTDFTAKLGSNSYYEVPFGFTGRISGIWSSANGNALIGELT